MAFDGAAMTAMLRRAAERVIDAEPELTRADQAIGDGDHGLGMARGFNAAVGALDGLADGVTPGAAFSAVGRAVLTKAGGASGAVFGSFFSGVGKALGDAAEVDEAGLAVGLRAGAEAVMARGKAKAGDKTMLDALLPAVEAMEGGGGLKAAAEAAARGAEATAAMQATTGRAKSLGARSVGHPDPGALSMRFILEGMADG
jgi:dihydroxyacetone kinase-like protein